MANTKGSWSRADECFLIQHHGKLSNPEIAQKLGRSIPAVESRTQVLRRSGAIPDAPREPDWTEAEDRKLIAGYAHFTTAMLAEDLGRTKDAVAARLKRLKKQGWQMEAMPRGRLRSKQAEKARAAHKPPELSVTAERIAMRDEVAAYLSAQIARNALAFEQAQVIAQTISKNVLQAPECQFKKLAKKSVVKIVQEAALATNGFPHRYLPRK